MWRKQSIQGRSIMKGWWALFKWHALNYKGRYCQQCGFYEASHYDHELEFDIESYPCGRFRISKRKMINRLKGEMTKNQAFLQGFIDGFALRPLWRWIIKVTKSNIGKSDE